MPLDVNRPAEFAPLLEAIVATTGRIDVLVNNAGILRPGAFEDLSDATLREVMDTNLHGPLNLTRAVLPYMRRQRDGYIIMISSLSGLAGLPGDVAYAASKFALEGATEALRHEVDRWHIKLALVEAALYATALFEQRPAVAAAAPPAPPSASPYHALNAHQSRTVCARLPEAAAPRAVGALLVESAASDGRQLRWPADARSRGVLATLLGQDDQARDRFLREVSGTDWWSAGADAPLIGSD